MKLTFAKSMLPIAAIALALFYIAAGAAEEKSESEAAFKKLIQDSRAQLKNADDKDQEVLKILENMAAFAKEYPNTDHAAFALINRGMLAKDLEKPDLAEESFKQAKGHTKDPKLLSEIESLLGQLNIAPGKIPPDFTAKSLDDKTVKLSEFKGKVVLLDFWATWCGPCVAEIPNVTNVYKEYHDKGLEIIGISGDRSEAPLRSFVKDRKMNWIHIFDGSQPESISDAYGVRAIPFMILIGRDGKIVAMNLRGPALEEAVKLAIEKKQD